MPHDPAHEHRQLPNTALKRNDKGVTQEADLATHVLSASLEDCCDMLVSAWQTSQPASSRQSLGISRTGAARQDDAVQAAAQC